MRILIGIDGSVSARLACSLVAERNWPAGTGVTLVGAVEPVVDLPGTLASPAAVGPEVGAMELVLDEHARIVGRAGLPVDTRVAIGKPAEELIAAATDVQADLVVVGSRGLGVAGSAVFGSVSAHLVDHAPCPVLVVRKPELSRMLLASDGTRSSRAIPSILATWGDAFRGIPVEVLSVAHPDGGLQRDGPDEVAMHEGIARQVADEMLELGWHSAATVRVGDPPREIVAEAGAWDADLIVTGSRGIGTLQRLIVGSVAHDVLMHVGASVLVMRGQVPSRVRGRERAVSPA